MNKNQYWKVVFIFLGFIFYNNVLEARQNSGGKKNKAKRSNSKLNSRSRRMGKSVIQEAASTDSVIKKLASVDTQEKAEMAIDMRERQNPRRMRKERAVRYDPSWDGAENNIDQYDEYLRDYTKDKVSYEIIVHYMMLNVILLSLSKDMITKNISSISYNEELVRSNTEKLKSIMEEEPLFDSTSSEFITICREIGKALASAIKNRNSKIYALYTEIINKYNQLLADRGEEIVFNNLISYINLIDDNLFKFRVNPFLIAVSTVINDKTDVEKFLYFDLQRKMFVYHLLLAGYDNTVFKEKVNMSLWKKGLISVAAVSLVAFLSGALLKKYVSPAVAADESRLKRMARRSTVPFVLFYDSVSKAPGKLKSWLGSWRGSKKAEEKQEVPKEEVPKEEAPKEEINKAKEQVPNEPVKQNDQVDKLIDQAREWRDVERMAKAEDFGGWDPLKVNSSSPWEPFKAENRNSPERKAARKAAIEKGKINNMLAVEEQKYKNWLNKHYYGYIDLRNIPEDVRKKYLAVREEEKQQEAGKRARKEATEERLKGLREEIEAGVYDR